MFTIFIILYNIFRSNKSKVHWLNLDNGEGVSTGMVGSLIDAFLILIIYYSL